MISNYNTVLVTFQDIVKAGILIPGCRRKTKLFVDNVPRFLLKRQATKLDQLDKLLEYNFYLISEAILVSRPKSFMFIKLATSYWRFINQKRSELKFTFSKIESYDY